MRPDAAPFGIVGVGHVVPENRVTPEVLAQAGRIDAGQLRSKVGFEARFEPAQDISPWHLMVQASQAALADARAQPDDVDLLVTVGRSRLEYLNWATGLSVMDGLGATKALVFDMSDFTGGSMLAGLRILAARFRSDPTVDTALLTFYQRYSDLADPRGNKDPWTWPIGDGGGALMLRRGAPGPQVLGHAFASEGRAARLMTLRVLAVDEGPHPGSWFDQQWGHAKYFALRDADKWYADYRERAVRRLAEVIGKAVERSGLRLDEVARVQTGFLYPEVAEQLGERLGLGRKVHRHNAHGQLAGAELAWALDALRKDAALKGKPMVLAAAHFPAEFGAMVLRL